MGQQAYVTSILSRASKSHFQLDKMNKPLLVLKGLQINLFTNVSPFRAVLSTIRTIIHRHMDIEL